MDLNQIQECIKNSKIELKTTEALLPYARNARLHSEDQIRQLVRSIKEFGFTNPVLVDGANEIVAGHGRVMAAKQLGMTEVPCIVLGHLSSAQKRAYAIADNQLALNSGWDEMRLSSELVELQQQSYDVSIVGFDDSEIKYYRDLFEQSQRDQLNTDKDKDNVPDIPSEDVWVKCGDVFRLGDHVISCGDATNAQDVAKLMGDQKADLVVTDPPYNVDYEGKTADALTIQNDKMPDDQFILFCKAFYTNYFNAMKPGASIYVFHADLMGHTFRKEFLLAGLYYSGCLIWNKNSLVMGRSDYHWKHEPCLYGWKPGASHRWFGDRTQSTVIDHDRPSRSAIHPTMKPVSLIEYLMRNLSVGGEIVLDLFGGSGSTLIAAESLGRKARLLELDPRYVQATLKRWEEFTGRKSEQVK